MNTPYQALLAVFYCICLLNPARGQMVALDEDFSGGVPPTGWTTVNHNSSGSQGWIASPDSRAWHEDEALAHGFTCDDSLVTPVLDLTAFSEVHLHFANDLGYANYLANHPNSRGDGQNNVEISLDGGATWTLIWTELRTNDGLVTTHVDLSSYAGLNNVQLAFRYYGTWAQEWWLDDVLIDDQAGGPLYSINNLLAGQNANFVVNQCAPFATVLIGYSTTGAGPTLTPYGYADMSLPIKVLTSLTADASGLATYSAYVPVAAAGFTLYSQCVELPAGNISNSLAELIL